MGPARAPRFLLASGLLLLAPGARATTHLIDLPQLSEAPRLRVAPSALISHGSCDGAAAALCYDGTERRIVYRQARQYMPQFVGLTAEGVSLRRNGIRFKYTFR